MLNWRIKYDAIYFKETVRLLTDQNYILRYKLCKLYERINWMNNFKSGTVLENDVKLSVLNYNNYIYMSWLLNYLFHKYATYLTTENLVSLWHTFELCYCVLITRNVVSQIFNSFNGVCLLNTHSTY